MSPTRRTHTELVRTFPATLDHVDPLCQEIRTFITTHGDANASFVVELVARECVNNAVLHGSRQDPTKTVTFRLRFTRRFISLRVTDQGPGFPWREILGRPLPDDNAVRGRGLPILEMYASRLRYSPDGTSITVWMARSGVEG